MSIRSSSRPPHQLLLACQDQQLIQLLQTLYGSNASVRDATQSPQHKNCVQILTSVRDQVNDDAAGTDLHGPDSGLAVYAFATPFILIIGNWSSRICKKRKRKCNVRTAHTSHRYMLHHSFYDILAKICQSELSILH